MKKVWKISLIVLIAFAFLILIGPFFVPIPPLENTWPAESLADPDSQFIEINGLKVHFKQAGSGTPVFILLHGFGASTFSWREVLNPLAEYGTVIAYDRSAFGLTERPLHWEGENPYSQENNLQLLLGLLDAMKIDQAILVGNSAGGTLATAFTLAFPERVQALVEVDAAIQQTFPESRLLHWLLQTPQVNHLGPLFTRRIAGAQGDAFLQSAWHDPSKLTQNPEIATGYRKPLQVQHWDQTLWKYTQAARTPNLQPRLEEITIPTLVITGDDDQIVPTENSIQLAEDIPGARLAVLENCGHLPQEECPADFLKAMDDFLMTIMEDNDEL